jgi:hypothetical protein
MELLAWLRAQWDRVGAWVLIVLGSVVLLVGWVGVSRSEYPAQQLPYLLSGGVGGLFFLGLGVAMWLSADLRDEWRKLDTIEDELRAIRVMLEGPEGTPVHVLLGNTESGPIPDTPRPDRVRRTEQSLAENTAGAKA